MDEKRLEQAEEEILENMEGSPKTDAASAQATADSKANEELGAEITRLAEAFTQAVRAAWNSDQRKQIETDLNRGLRSLVDTVEERLVDFNRSEQGQELREQAERVVEKVRTSKVTEDVRDGLTKGLGAIAAELQEFAERMEQHRAEEDKPAGDDAQDIPVKKDGEA
ncbi:MAG: hypothetical protein R2873_12680 [Caldilineaceae bacterium]